MTIPILGKKGPAQTMAGLTPEEMAQRAALVRNTKLEMLAAAFAKEMGPEASKYSLIQEQSEDLRTITWRFVLVPELPKTEQVQQLLLSALYQRCERLTKQLLDHGIEIPETPEPPE